jgi:cytochrome bd ubiquinol oxidase subunit I
MAMELTALLLSRLLWAFTISFHIIFPSFTIGFAAWLTVLEALHFASGRPAYRPVFEFWLKIFGVAFGLGVVSSIVMAFQFGTNWSKLSRMSGTIQGPLLSYETFTGFALEASFFGILLFGRSRIDGVKVVSCHGVRACRARCDVFSDIRRGQPCACRGVQA